MKPASDLSAEEVNRKLVDDYTQIARLAGSLAHEIKNPLSTIGLNMELLAEDVAQDDSPRARRSLAKIAVVQRECQRLQDLLNDFLNFAKVRELRLESSDLNEEVRRVLDFFRPKAAESALRRVEALTESVTVGKIYDGRVTSVKDFGAFVEILPGKDGLCHISELSDDYVNSVADVCKVGDQMSVKVIAIDDQDRVKLSRKVAMRELAGDNGDAPR